MELHVMELDCLTSDQEFDSLEPEWNPLVERAAPNMPFLRFEYLRTWWRTRGGSEWNDAALRLVIAREAGSLVGVAPFFRTLHDGRQSWLLLGSFEISDYLDLIVAEGHEETFGERLLDHASAQSDDELHVMDLYNLRAASRTLAALPALAGTRGWRQETQELQPCPPIALPEDWDVFLERLREREGRR